VGDTIQFTDTGPTDQDESTEEPELEDESSLSEDDFASLRGEDDE
jgi:hypothetical protein